MVFEKSAEEIFEITNVRVLLLFTRLLLNFIKMLDNVHEVWSPFSLEEQTGVHQMTHFLTCFRRCLMFVPYVADSSCALCRRAASMGNLPCKHF